MKILQIGAVIIMILLVCLLIGISAMKSFKRGRGYSLLEGKVFNRINEEAFFMSDIDTNRPFGDITKGIEIAPNTIDDFSTAILKFGNKKEVI